MDIIIVIITVHCYTINMTVLKFILQPGNNGLRNWFQYTTIISRRSLLFIREYKVFKSKTRKDIQFQNNTQKLYKYIYYVRYYSNAYRPHKHLHDIFYSIVYLYYVLYNLFQNIPIFLLNVATNRSINFNITFLSLRNNNHRLQ
jgi:hypothetical protein